MDTYQGYSEEKLVAKLRLGDTRALATLYHTYVGKLKFFVRRTAKSPFLTEDIVHDIFVKLWENRTQIDPEKPFQPYLFTIAKNQLINVVKRAQHETRILDEIQKFAKVGERTTDLALDYRESHVLFQEAVGQLSGQPKEVFLRCRMAGMSYKQAARDLGITESTVNKHMNRALQQVREYINLKYTLSIILATIVQLP